MTLPPTALVAGLLLGSAAAQSPLQQSWHASPAQQGASVFADRMAVADFNGDGFDDLVATQPSFDLPGLPNAGRAWVLFGPTFSPTISFQPADPGWDEQFGTGGVSLGDVNGDGALDILVGSPFWMLGSWDEVGRAHLFFGPDFQVGIVLDDPAPQPGARYGGSVLLADTTGDGLADVFVGAKLAEVHGHPVDSGKVVFRDATDLATPRTLLSPEPIANAWFGSSLDAALMDDDEVVDLMVGAENFKLCCPIKYGRIYVLSGKDLLCIQIIIPPQFGAQRFGDVAHAGDLTGDGVQDLLVTAYATVINDGLDCDGAVFLLAGPTYEGATHVFSPVPADCDGGDNFGRDTVVQDLNGDGSLDVIITQPSLIQNENRVQVFYGPDWRTVQTLGDFGLFIAQGFGNELASADIDGDGLDELLVHVSHGNGVGEIALYDLQTLQVDAPVISLGVGGTTSWSLDLAQDSAGHVYLAALGASGKWPGVVAGPGSWLPLNVDPLTHIGLSLIGTPALPGFLGVLDANGQASFSLSFPAGGVPSLVGQSVTVAVITALPDGRPGAGSSSTTVALTP